MLARNTTWTLGREASARPRLRRINFYDGQGFMVKQSSGVTIAPGSSTARPSACSPARRPS